MLLIQKDLYRKVLLICGALTHVACATSHKGKVFESMALGAVAGGLYGSTRPEFKQENALLFASMGAALGATYIELTSDLDKENQKKIEAYQELESALSSKKVDSGQKEKIFSGSAVISPHRIPPKLRKVLNQGNLTGFKADEWIDWGDNRAAHVDEIWELNPAEFNLEK
jgi:hypothetical protein